MQFKRLTLTAVLGIAVVGADALSKRLAETSLSQGLEVALTPFLNLRLGFNPGISFGLFPVGSPSGVAILIVVQGLIIAGMVIFAMWSRLLLERAAFSLIIGGAVGNVIDRARDGLVTDFLDLHLQGWHWPTFNIADMAICFGVALLLWTSVRPRPAQAPVG
jgi:signal peptidase II